MSSRDVAAASLTTNSTGGSTVGTLIREMAQIQPEYLAVGDGETYLNYRQFNARVNQLSNALNRMGLKKRDNIAILAKNSIVYVEIMVAAAKCGLILCCQNWRLTRSELEHTISLVSPALIFTEAEFADHIPKLLDVPRITIGDNYESLIEGEPDTEPDVYVNSEDGLLILYTSGTTGYPKGAFISHRAMIFRALVYSSELGVPRDDTFFAWSPLFHIGAADQSFATLMRGGLVFVTDGMKTDTIIPALERFRTQWFSLLPGVLDELVIAIRNTKPRLMGVAIVGGMGDLVGRERIAELTELFSAPYLESFGSTETGLPPATGGTIPIGVTPERMLKRQSAFCELRLLDENQQPVPDGVPGEVVIKGPTLFSGYYNNQKANEECVKQDWYYMGDVMIRDPATGYLEFVDRAKYLIKSGGENIYPAEIERVLSLDPRIDIVTIVRHQDDRWGEVPVAFVARNTLELDEAKVIELCSDHLAKYKQPKAVHFIESDAFPRTSSGKIKRNELEARLKIDAKTT